MPIGSDLLFVLRQPRQSRYIKHGRPKSHPDKSRRTLRQRLGEKNAPQGAFDRFIRTNGRPKLVLAKSFSTEVSADIRGPYRSQMPKRSQEAHVSRHCELQTWHGSHNQHIALQAASVLPHQLSFCSSSEPLSSVRET